MTANRRIFLNIVATYGRSLYALANGSHQQILVHGGRPPCRCPKFKLKNTDLMRCVHKIGNDVTVSYRTYRYPRDNRGIAPYRLTHRRYRQMLRLLCDVPAKRLFRQEYDFQRRELCCTFRNDHSRYQKSFSLLLQKKPCKLLIEELIKANHSGDEISGLAPVKVLSTVVAKAMPCIPLGEFARKRDILTLALREYVSDVDVNLFRSEKSIIVSSL